MIGYGGETVVSHPRIGASLSQSETQLDFELKGASLRERNAQLDCIDW